VAHGHQRVVAEAPADGVVAVALLVLESVLPVALPETEPEPVVPVAPIDVVPLVLGVVVVLVLAVPVPLSDDDPLVEPGVVDAVEELVDGDDGVVLFVVEDVVDSLVSRLVQAPRDRAATTARAAPAAWVRVIFIRNSLVGADTTLGRHSSRRVGTRCKRM
jgi:hypothetical protein